VCGPDKQVAVQLERLRNADPGADVAAAIRAGDLRFLAINGFVSETPGVPGTRKNALIVWLYGQRVMEGMSDYGPSPEFHIVAKRYATKYNEELMNYIKRERFYGWLR
jgi:hypothetical protein